MTDILN